MFCSRHDCGCVGVRTCVPVFLYCNYLMAWVMVVLPVVLTEHVLLGGLCVCVCVTFFPVCFIWGLFMKLTDVFLKRTIISFQIQYFSLLVFPEWAWFCCCFSSIRVKRVPLKIPVASLNTPVVFFSLFNVLAILWTCLDV